VDDLSGKADDTRKWQVSSMLVDEDKARGFSVAANCQHITLLRRGNEVARFSVSLSPQTIRTFVELVKDCEGKRSWVS